MQKVDGELLGQSELPLSNHDVQPALSIGTGASKK
jgi:hypothetical protein